MTIIIYHQQLLALGLLKRAMHACNIIAIYSFLSINSAVAAVSYKSNYSVLITARSIVDSLQRTGPAL